MAQASVELPDPLSQSHESGASADDLLSQLAGNEIDRLLSEADSEHSPKLFKPILDPKMIPSPAHAAKAAPVADADVSKHVGRVLETIDEGARSAPPPPAPEAEPEGEILTEPERNEKERQAILEAAGFDAQGKPTTTTIDPSDENAPAPTEREALLIAAGFDAKAADDPEEAQDEVPREYAPPLPYYLMPLQLFSSPLDACPQGVREVMGKLAIVTMINALAAIGFVLFIRKH